MPFKHNADRRHHISRQKRRVGHGRGDCWLAGDAPAGPGRPGGLLGAGHPDGADAAVSVQAGAAPDAGADPLDLWPSRTRSGGDGLFDAEPALEDGPRSST